MRFKRLVLNAFFASLSCSTGAFGEECPDWLETDFWKSAEPEEVHSCLQAGRSLFERTDDGETPLHLSVAAASPDTVLELLRSGADVSLTTTDGLTPLHVAARDTIHGTVISYLLVYGSEVDKRIPPDLCYAGTCAETALHLAADLRNAAPLLAVLLAGGADPNADDSAGREPLQRAVVGAGLPEIDVLLKAGAAIDEKDFEGNTALHVVPQNKTNELFVAQRLIAAGADVDAQRDDEVTPLIAVAYYTTDPNVFAFFLAQSDDPCHASATETTALTGHDFNPALTKDEAYWSLHEQCSQDSSGYSNSPRPRSCYWSWSARRVSTS
ncbi:ankyrin repeat domain-containing protein [Mameliella sp. CS4]|uniref:ankyrin repeat domain-containing protein n=1 Tax=Mameliella sp. CS4 TaxID=2862329 RepID=UPI001C60618A|nr:ankyrin repeat domain-containing protein [Mameliella sp. CS4]MBW4986051.1 ankyrin repeat domain-containing protein [Mameliella sp. CS4]